MSRQPSTLTKARFGHSRLRGPIRRETTSERFTLHAWLVNMVPYWLVRLNDFLAWLNPTLGLVACVLALLVIAVAGERSPRKAASPAVQMARSFDALSSVECPRGVLPPELRDLRLYD